MVDDLRHGMIHLWIYGEPAITVPYKEHGIQCLIKELEEHRDMVRGKCGMEDD